MPCEAFGGLSRGDAEPAAKAAIYEQLGIKITYQPGHDKIRAESRSARIHSQVKQAGMG